MTVFPPVHPSTTRHPSTLHPPSTIPPTLRNETQSSSDPNAISRGCPGAQAPMRGRLHNPQVAHRHGRVAAAVGTLESVESVEGWVWVGGGLMACVWDVWVASQPGTGAGQKCSRLTFIDNGSWRARLEGPSLQSPHLIPFSSHAPLLSLSASLVSPVQLWLRATGSTRKERARARTWLGFKRAKKKDDIKREKKKKLQKIQTEIWRVDPRRTARHACTAQGRRGLQRERGVGWAGWWWKWWCQDFQNSASNPSGMEG